MGKTFRTARPIPADLSNGQERPVRESTLRRFSKAMKKLTHHRDRRRASAFISRQMEEAI